MHSGRLVCHFSALTHVMQEVIVLPEEVNVEVVAGEEVPGVVFICKAVELVEVK